MPKRSVVDADVRGKRVLVRVDFNVPFRDGEITDDTRIRAALPTIRLLLDRGSAVVLMTHLGRPKGTPDPRFSIAPVAAKLAQLLDRSVVANSSPSGPEAEAAVSRLASGDVLLLENTRFEPGEETNDPSLAAAFARLGDLFVNDAFGAAHRAHASTVGVATHLPAYAGLLLDREVAMLTRLLNEPARPFVAILGGAKVSDKLAVIGNLLERVDALLLGGGMANTVLLAQGRSIGRSLAEPDRIDDAKRLLTRAEDRGVEVLLPNDVVVAANAESGDTETVPVDGIPEHLAVFDIGPEAVERFSDAIRQAKTIFWNGPMGVFERPPFASGTLGIANAVAGANAFSVVGGGDSIAAIEAAGIGHQIDHISTGGGASLEFLEGKALPGIAAIPDA